MIIIVFTGQGLLTDRIPMHQVVYDDCIIQAIRISSDRSSSQQRKPDRKCCTLPFFGNGINPACVL